MKHKVAELEGALLDAAVKLANHAGTSPIHYSHGRGYSPSVNWSQGGPIIQRELITIEPAATVDGLPDNCMIGARACHPRCGTDAWGPGSQTGPTFLVAAMRAYVASKFGDEIELP
jgi:hypothetical protein